MKLSVYAKPLPSIYFTYFLNIFHLSSLLSFLKCVFFVANFHVVWCLLLLASHFNYEIFHQANDIEMVTIEQGATIGQHTEALSQLAIDLSSLEAKSSEHSGEIADIKQQVVCTCISYGLLAILELDCPTTPLEVGHY